MTVYHSVSTTTSIVIHFGMPITTIPRRPHGDEGTHLDERWFTVEQIAQQIQVSEQTVRRWLRDGSLRGHTFGGKAGWRVKESDLNTYLETRRPSPGQSFR
jgi:excisionase family DNA binding protein